MRRAGGGSGPVPGPAAHGKAPGRRTRALALGLALALAGCASGGPTSAPAAGPPPGAALLRGYRAYVAGSGGVGVVVFNPGQGIREVATVPVGGAGTPRGVAVSPDGRHWYLSLAGGEAAGSVRKHTVAGDSLVGEAEVGRSPAAIGVTPDGQFLYVVDAGPVDDPVPGSVSVVFAPTMTEVARPESCIAARGSRVGASGATHYSACMDSDQLVEIDTRTFEVSRRFSVAPGREGPLHPGDAGEHAAPQGGGPTCSPTWAQPGRGERAEQLVYVACSASGEVLEVDLRESRVRRRFRTGGAPHALDVSPDGRLLVATLRGAQAVQVIELGRGATLATVATTHPNAHGVVVTPDGRYVLVASGAPGEGRGAVDVFDLRSLERVGVAEVRGGAGEIALVP